MHDTGYGMSSALQRKQALAPLVHTPDFVIDAALKLAKLQPGDVFLELGCGDGRVMVQAAKKHGCRAVGFDIFAQCLAKSREKAQKAGVSHLVEVIEHDIFQFRSHDSYRNATCLYAYLTAAFVRMLEPELRQAVNDGKRVVIYCTSGCQPRDDVPVDPSKLGNGIGDLVPADRALLGMLRLYRRADGMPAPVDASDDDACNFEAQEVNDFLCDQNSLAHCTPACRGLP